MSYSLTNARYLQSGIVSIPHTAKLGPVQAQPPQRPPCLRPALPDAAITMSHAGRADWPDPARWKWRSVGWHSHFLDFHGVCPLAVLVASGVSACLSAIGVSLAALQESPGQVRDHVGLLVQSEVAGVEDVDLGVWHVPAVRLGLLNLERWVVAAPYDL